MDFETAFKLMPACVSAGVDPLRHTTVDDLRALVEHEIDLYEEGEESGIVNGLDLSRCKKFMKQTQEGELIMTPWENHLNTFIPTANTNEAARIAHILMLKGDAYLSPREKEWIEKRRQTRFKKRRKEFLLKAGAEADCLGDAPMGGSFYAIDLEEQKLMEFVGNKPMETQTYHFLEPVIRGYIDKNPDKEFALVKVIAFYSKDSFKDC